MTMKLAIVARAEGGGFEVLPRPSDAAKAERLYPHANPVWLPGVYNHFGEIIEDIWQRDVLAFAEDEGWRSVYFADLSAGAHNLNNLSEVFAETFKDRPMVGSFVLPAEPQEPDNTEFHDFKVSSGRSVLEPDSFIELDGQKLRGVQKVELSMAIGQVTTVTVTFIPKRVEIDGVAHYVELPPELRFDCPACSAEITVLNNNGDEHNLLVLTKDEHTEVHRHCVDYRETEGAGDETEAGDSTGERRED